MAEELSLRALLVRIEKLEARNKEVEEALAVFAKYDDADSNNPNTPRLIPAIVTRFSRKYANADILILDARRSGGIWQRDDVPLGIGRGKWQPLLIPQSSKELLEEARQQAEEQKAEEQKAEEQKPEEGEARSNVPSSSSRRPAAVARP